MGSEIMAEMNFMQRAKTNGYGSFLRRRFSLVRQASLDRCQNAEIRRKVAEDHRHKLEAEAEQTVASKDTAKVLQQLNDEGVELIWASSEHTMQFSAVLTCDGPKSVLVDLAHALTTHGMELNHIETRLHRKADQSYYPSSGFDVLVECESTKNAFLSAAGELDKVKGLNKLELFKPHQEHDVPWFPTNIWELDKCGAVVIKYEPTTDPRHPGYGDEEYVARRSHLCELAATHKHGRPLPKVDYTEDEHRTWQESYGKLKQLYPTHACAEYQRNLRLIEDAVVFTTDKIPQLEDVSRYLQGRTGFQLRPCGGLLSARDFLASLAFRVFQATQYVRHASSPHHSPEPDVIHEMLGHAPMFADPVMAQFSQEIGLLSLGASDEEIEKLATVYWFIIEFGLSRESGQLRAIGAGLLSAFGELQHAVSDAPAHKDFHPETTALQPYQDDDYQPLYFVAESINDAVTKLRRYATTIRRDFSILYDPFTQSVKKVKHANDLTDSIDRLKFDLGSLGVALDFISKK